MSVSVCVCVCVVLSVYEEIGLSNSHSSFPDNHGVQSLASESKVEGFSVFESGWCFPREYFVPLTSP